mmetsp:Transcript_102944/g.296447  ORF Transcript_102944/g.296447 Transcript_102944/m.296447 type:complete len:255 (-) Transcript_102944:263-1027(-)
MVQAGFRVGVGCELLLRLGQLSLRRGLLLGCGGDALLRLVQLLLREADRVFQRLPLHLIIMQGLRLLLPRRLQLTLRLVVQALQGLVDAAAVALIGRSAGGAALRVAVVRSLCVLHESGEFCCVVTRDKLGLHHDAQRLCEAGGALHLQHRSAALCLLALEHFDRAPDHVDGLCELRLLGGEVSVLLLSDLRRLLHVRLVACDALRELVHAGGERRDACGLFVNHGLQVLDVGLGRFDLVAQVPDTVLAPFSEL